MHRKSKGFNIKPIGTEQDIQYKNKGEGALFTATKSFKCEEFPRQNVKTKLQDFDENRSSLVPLTSGSRLIFEQPLTWLDPNLLIQLAFLDS